jgi:hypothetical protein
VEFTRSQDRGEDLTAGVKSLADRVETVFFVSVGKALLEGSGSERGGSRGSRELAYSLPASGEAQTSRSSRQGVKKSAAS